MKTGSNLILWPVEEVEGLRTNEKTFSDVPVTAGSTVQLDVGQASQVGDLVQAFTIQMCLHIVLRNKC